MEPRRVVSDLTHVRDATLFGTASGGIRSNLPIVLAERFQKARKLEQPAALVRIRVWCF